MLSPSRAPIWGRCSGSPGQRPPLHARRKVETYRASALAARWLAASCLNTWRGSGVITGSITPKSYVDDSAPNGVVIDQQIAEGVEVYTADVMDIVGCRAVGNAELLVEKPVEMPQIHPSAQGLVPAAFRMSNVIYLWLYKNGHSRVEAVDNLEIISYAEGLRELYQIGDQEALRVQIVARIVQPFAYDRRGPISEWSFMLSDISDQIRQLHLKALEAKTDPRLTSGTHCRYCPAHGKCSALRGAVGNMIDFIDSPMYFDDMSAADLAVERDMLIRGQTQLKARLEAIEDDLTYRVKRGDDCGLSLVDVPGRLKWSVSTEQAIAAAHLFEVDISRPHCDTPAQARKRVPSKARKSFDCAIKALTQRSSSLKLVSSDDTPTAKVFKSCQN